MSNQDTQDKYAVVVQPATAEDEKAFAQIRRAMERSHKYPDRYPSIGTVDGSHPDDNDYQRFINQAMTSLDLWPTEDNFDFWMKCVADYHFYKAFEAMGDFKLAMETSSSRRQQQAQTED